MKNQPTDITITLTWKPDESFASDEELKQMTSENVVEVIMEDPVGILLESAKWTISRGGEVVLKNASWGYISSLRLP